MRNVEKRPNMHDRLKPIQDQCSHHIIEKVKKRKLIKLGKSKELWESLKYLGIPNKALISNFNAMEDNDTLTDDTRSISTVFKNFFSDLAKFLLTKLPNPPDNYNLESNINYYSSLTITDDFCLNKTSENKVFNIIKKIDISKTAGIDRLSGCFLRGGAEILSRPISEICNLLISRRAVFPDAGKAAALKPIYKKGEKRDTSNYGPVS